MIGIGLPLVVILAITFAAWLSVVLWWRRKPVRYVALLLAIWGTWFLVRFFTYDPNSSPAAKAWYGQYLIDECTRGTPWDGQANGPILSLYAEKVCTWQTSGTDNAPTIGSWDYVCDEDMCYLELVLSTTGVIQLYGDSSSFRSNTPFPIAGCR